MFVWRIQNPALWNSKFSSGNPESRKLLEYGIQVPLSRNAESEESSSWNTKSIAWNPESKTLLYDQEPIWITLCRATDRIWGRVFKPDKCPDVSRLLSLYEWKQEGLFDEVRKDFRIVLFPFVNMRFFMMLISPTFLRKSVTVAQCNT